MRKKLINDFTDNDSDDSLDLSESRSLDNSYDDYEEDELNKFYEDPDNIFDEFDEPKSIEEELKEEKKRRKKEFYVKGSELKEEIQKYHDSKKTTEDRKRNYI